jgi:hypothetical protein
MRISTAFPTNYLSAPDLRGREHIVEIDRVTTEVFEDGEKPIVWFRDRTKGLTLNKTNAATIAEAYGDETDAWRGREVLLYPARVDFKGKVVDAIRVRIPQRQAAAPPVVIPATAPVLDDDVPF